LQLHGYRQANVVLQASPTQFSQPITLQETVMIVGALVGS